MHMQLFTKKYKYVIHEHHASHLHWDLRLEHHGVLKSWAVPKKPSPNPAVKRLAIQVPGHALSYAKFHGTIPKGYYGAGTVKIWDSGWHEPQAWTSTKVITKLHGKKLKGLYCLTKFPQSGPKNWLFFKKKETKMKKGYRKGRFL